MSFIIQDFGNYKNQKYKLYTFTNKNNLSFSVTDFGARLVKFESPDRNGKLINITLGFDTLQGYVDDEYYFGASIGRFAGRIKDAEFELDNHYYKLSANNDKNTLHGGFNSISHRHWNAETIEEENKVGIIFSLISPDLDNGFPGNLSISAKYLLGNDNSLTIQYTATTDKKTIINLTNHSYFNLLGNVANILNHEIKINSDKYLEVNQNLLSTGRIININNYFSEFRTLESILECINFNDIDLSYVLADKNQCVLDLRESSCGRGLRIFTNQNTAQVFTSKRLADQVLSGNFKSQCFAGIALEMQNYLDSIHHKSFTCAILNPGEKYLNKQVILPYTF